MVGDNISNVPWDPREVERPYPLIHRPEQAPSVRAPSEQQPGTRICHSSPCDEQSPRQLPEETNLLLKPCVAHNEIAILSSSLAPGVLNLVADRLAGWVEVNTRNDHSVRHCRVAYLETVGFAQP